METKDFLDMNDIYCAAFLSLKGLQPDLIRDYGNHFVFRFPRAETTHSLIAEFSVENPSILVRDYAGALRKLRARMILAKDLEVAG